MGTPVDERSLAAIRVQLTKVQAAVSQLGPIADLWEQTRNIFQFSSPNVRTSLEKSREIREKIIKLLEQPKCSYDDTVLAVAGLLKELPASQRQGIRGLIGEPQMSALSPYVSRADWLALEERSVERLLSGLIVQALVLPDHEDERDVAAALASAHVCAKSLGIDPAPLFDEAAGFAGKEVDKTFKEFGRRSDVTLEAFGLERVETPHGARIRQRNTNTL
jgi:hypothetical protein